MGYSPLGTPKKNKNSLNRAVCLRTDAIPIQGVFIFAASLQKVLFSTLFNMGDSAAYVCGKLPPQKFQIGEVKTPRCGKPRKINFCPRLSFGKKKKSLHFSPKASSIRPEEYNRYNGMLPKRWKTRWKKWKTLWETPLLFHKSSGKPGGKS